MGSDPGYQGNVFSFAFPMVLACDRHLATMLPVNMRFKSGGYKAGEVIARNTGDGNYDSYAGGGASGTGVAAAVLFNPVDFGGATGGFQSAVGIFAGRVYVSKLTGFVAAVSGDLAGRVVTDMSGDQILIF